MKTATDDFTSFVESNFAVIPFHVPARNSLLTTNTRARVSTVIPFVRSATSVAVPSFNRTIYETKQRSPDLLNESRNISYSPEHVKRKRFAVHGDIIAYRDVRRMIFRKLISRRLQRFNRRNPKTRAPDSFSGSLSPVFRFTVYTGRARPKIV